MSFGRDMASAMATGILMLVGAAFASGALFAWLIPKLWHWIKPLIHMVTA